MTFTLKEEYVTRFALYILVKRRVWAAYAPTCLPANGWCLSTCPFPARLSIPVFIFVRWPTRLSVCVCLLPFTCPIHVTRMPVKPRGYWLAYDLYNSLIRKIHHSVSVYIRARGVLSLGLQMKAKCFPRLSNLWPDGTMGGCLVAEWRTLKDTGGEKLLSYKSHQNRSWSNMYLFYELSILKKQ